MSQQKILRDDGVAALKKYHISQFEKELQVICSIKCLFYLYPTSSVLIPLMLSTLACLG